MEQVITIFTNPILYTSILGVLMAFYVIWTLARRQYLGVDKLFNVLALSIAAGWFIGWLVQSIRLKIWEENFSLSQLWVHPTPVVVLAGYLGIWLVATRYVRLIRYPYWRLMDMLFISLAIIQASLFLGWTIADFNWYALTATVLSILVCVGLFWLYGRIERSGLVSGVQSATFFSVLLGLHLLTPTWQGQGGGVEWIADAVGVLLGVTLVILRFSAQSEKAIFQDIPRGVSQSFQETFTRAFTKKPADSKSDK